MRCERLANPSAGIHRSHENECHAAEARGANKEEGECAWDVVGRPGGDVVGQLAGSDRQAVSYGNRSPSATKATAARSRSAGRRTRGLSRRRALAGLVIWAS